MGGASRTHVIINSNLTGELTQKLRARECVVYANDLRFLVSSTGLYTYPDIVVSCGAEQFTDNSFDTLLSPLVLLEILSESTKNYDRGQKFESYRSFPSLREYFTVSQDAIRVEHWQRLENGQWLLTECNSKDDILRLNSLEIEVEASSIYNKIIF